MAGHHTCNNAQPNCPVNQVDIHLTLNHGRNYLLTYKADRNAAPLPWSAIKEQLRTRFEIILRMMDQEIEPPMTPEEAREILDQHMRNSPLVGFDDQGRRERRTYKGCQ